MGVSKSRFKDTHVCITIIIISHKARRSNLFSFPFRKVWIILISICLAGVSLAVARGDPFQTYFINMIRKLKEKIQPSPRLEPRTSRVAARDGTHQTTPFTGLRIAYSNQKHFLEGGRLAEWPNRQSIFCHHFISTTNCRQKIKNE